MAVQLSVQVRNAQLVEKRFQDLTEEMPKIGRQQIRVVMERIKRRMQEYPPEPPGQSIAEAHPLLGTVYRTAAGRYHRTGLLGASWFIDRTPKDDGYTIKNDAQRKGRGYARYVVGSARGDGQAWMHKGRWQLLRNVADEEVQKLPEEITKSVTMIARKRGF